MRSLLPLACYGTPFSYLLCMTLSSRLAQAIKFLYFLQVLLAYSVLLHTPRSHLQCLSFHAETWLSVCMSKYTVNQTQCKSFRWFQQQQDQASK